MPLRKIVSLNIDWHIKTIKKNENIKYKLFLTKKGPIIKKIIQKKLNHNRSNKNKNTNNKISLNIYKNIEKQERINIKLRRNVEVTVNTAKKKNKSYIDENELTKQMNNLSIATKPTNINKRIWNDVTSNINKRAKLN